MVEITWLEIVRISQATSWACYPGQAQHAGHIECNHPILQRMCAFSAISPPPFFFFTFIDNIQDIIFPTDRTKTLLEGVLCIRVHGTCKQKMNNRFILATVTHRTNTDIRNFRTASNFHIRHTYVTHQLKTAISHHKNTRSRAQTPGRF